MLTLLDNSGIVVEICCFSRLRRKERLPVVVVEVDVGLGMGVGLRPLVRVEGLLRIVVEVVHRNSGRPGVVVHAHGLGLHGKVVVFWSRT